jgi:outer membrane protein OmpA-like peptidoglycan-associated protein
MFKKLLFAFSSLTVAATITAFACDASSERTIDNDNNKVIVNEIGENTYVPIQTQDGKMICVPAGSSVVGSLTSEHRAEASRMKTLGFLKPGTVLPTLSKPYSYEDAKKKEELERLKRKKGSIKKARTSKIEKKPDHAIVSYGSDSNKEQFNGESHSSSEVVRSNSSAAQQDKHSSNEHQDNKHGSSSSSEKPKNTYASASTVPAVKLSEVSNAQSSNKDVESHGNKLARTKPENIGNNTKTNTETLLKSPSAQDPMPLLVAPNSNLQEKPVGMADSLVSESEVKPISVDAQTSLGLNKIVSLEYKESDLEILSNNIPLLSNIVDGMRSNPGQSIKIQSYAFNKDGNGSEARKVSFQRALNVRKYLVDNDISPSRISVNAVEDTNNKSNKVEIVLEETKST